MVEITKEIIFLGDACTGKTSIINRIVGIKFNENYEKSIAMDFRYKKIEFENKIFKFKLWDIPGQEINKSLFSSYLKNSSLIFLIYDVSNKSSFNNIDNWINYINSEKYLEKPIIILCGNKIDLKREIQQKEGEEKANKFGYLFFECSAKNGENIKNMFYSSIINLSIFGSKFEKENFIKKLMNEEEKEEKENNNDSCDDCINDINKKYKKLKEEKEKINNEKKKLMNNQKILNEEINKLKKESFDENKKNQIIQYWKKENVIKLEIKSNNNKELILQKDKIIKDLISKINNLKKELKELFKNNSHDNVENIINLLKNELIDAQDEMNKEQTELEQLKKQIKKYLEKERELKEGQEIINKKYQNLLAEKIILKEIKQEDYNKIRDQKKELQLFQKSIEDKDNIKKEIEINQNNLIKTYENIKEKLNEELRNIKEELKKEKKEVERLNSIINSSFIKEIAISNINENNNKEDSDNENNDDENNNKEYSDSDKENNNDENNIKEDNEKENNNNIKNDNKKINNNENNNDKNNNKKDNNEENNNKNNENNNKKNNNNENNNINIENSNEEYNNKKDNNEENNNNNENNKNKNNNKKDNKGNNNNQIILEKEHVNELSQINNINNENNHEFSYECINKNNLMIDIYEGFDDSVDFEIILKNNGEKKWGEGAKLSSCCDYPVITINLFNLEQQNPGEIIKYKVNIGNLKFLKAKEYKIYFVFYCNGKKYGEKLEIIINIKSLN